MEVQLTHHNYYSAASLTLVTARVRCTGSPSVTGFILIGGGVGGGGGGGGGGGVANFEQP